MQQALHPCAVALIRHRLLPIQVQQRGEACGKRRESAAPGYGCSQRQTRRATALSSRNRFALVPAQQCYAPIPKAKVLLQRQGRAWIALRLSSGGRGMHNPGN